MAKQPNKSTALVAVNRRKPPAKRKAQSLATVAATADTLIPILGSELAVSKLLGNGGEVTREEGVILVTGRAYATRECVIPADEIYYNRSPGLNSDGRQLGEADKVSWRDEVTGYDCIMLRDTRHGFLSGYVGVPSDHPLWGWECEAVPPDLGICVHGGLTYSMICEDGPSPVRSLAEEARRICHVAFAAALYHPTTQATENRVGDAHAWWFGFECNHAYDGMPGDHLRRAGVKAGTTYRDDGYVAREVANLAAQLRAIADGIAAPPRAGPPPPPIGLDPNRGGGRGGY